MNHRRRRRVVPALILDGRPHAGGLVWRQFVAAGWADCPSNDPFDRHYAQAIERCFTQVWRWWVRLSHRSRCIISGLHGERENRDRLSRKRWAKPKTTRRFA